MSGIAGRSETLSDEGNFYRYTVKCNRAFNSRIEKAAKAAGVSATTFVQEHFNSILGSQLTEASDLDAPKRRVKVSDAERSRILKVLRAAADAGGCVTMSYGQTAKSSRVPSDKTRSCMADLVEDGVLVKLPAKGQIAVHRFVERG